MPAGYDNVGYEAVELSRLRRSIARNLQDSWNSAPQLTAQVDIDFTAVSVARAQVNRNRTARNEPKISFLPYLAFAVCRAAAEHPDVNATFTDSHLIRWKPVNLGIAVDTPNGLMVPVIENAQNLSLTGLAAAIADLGTKASAGALSPEALSGGTITISNSGSVGGVISTPILTTPQVTSIGFPSIIRTPVARRSADGNSEILAIRPIARLGADFRPPCVRRRRGAADSDVRAECPRNLAGRQQMRAAVLRSGEITFAEIAVPVVGPEQLLIEPIAAGVCGSDLSAWQHTEDFLTAHAEADVPGEVFDPDADLVMGHEFTGRVVGVGEGVVGYAVGDRLVVLPWVLEDDGIVHTVGIYGTSSWCTVRPGCCSSRWPPVDPDDVDAVSAAVTEPMATGVNAVLRSGIESAARAVVIGCGPVGLGVIVELAERGVETIIASDPSARRRDIASKYGAHVVVDPFTDDPISQLEAAENSDLPTFVFEASGVRGMLGRLMESSPKFTRIVVVGSSMVPETIRPVVGILKNSSIEFVGGPGRGELTYAAFTRTFELIVAGRFDPSAMVTGFASIDAVADVFRALRPSSGSVEHVKILVRPDLPTGTGLVTTCGSSPTAVDKDPS